MVDAIIGGQYHDRVVGKDFTVVGIYERAVRDEQGAIVDSEVVVDVQYDDGDDPVRVELYRFKGDEGMVLIEPPAWF